MSSVPEIPCSLPECGRQVKSKGLCAKHYLAEYYRANKKRAAERQAEWYRANREANLAYQKQWRTENDQALRVKAKQRRENNHAQVLASKLAYREARRQELADKQREYAQANPEIVAKNARVSYLRRRARMAQVEHEDFTDQDMLDLYGTDCYLCAEPIDMTAPRRVGVPGWERGLHRDHVVPIAKGGPDTLANSLPAHGICNLRKSSK